MIIIDFFSLTGAWVDSCESWQIDTVLPRLQVLYGAVAMVERGAAVDAVADDFST